MLDGNIPTEHGGIPNSQVLFLVLIYKYKDNGAAKWIQQYLLKLKATNWDKWQ